MKKILRVSSSRQPRVYSDPEVLELFVDDPEKLAVVDAIAATQRSRRARRLPVTATLIAAAAASILVAIFGPWHGHGRGIIDQALAAVGTRPVVHTIVSSDLPHDERVSLRTGEATPVRVQVETWYDSERNVVRSVIRHDHVSVDDEAGGAASRAVPGLTDGGVRQFALGYRPALSDGSAAVIRRGEFEGRRAVWLRVRFGARHQEVIVDADTFRPRAFHEIGTVQATLWRVDRIESTGREPRDFVVHPVTGAEGGRVVSEAPATMEAVKRDAGFAPVTPGDRIDGLIFDSVAVQKLVRAGDNEAARTTGVVLRYRGTRSRLEISEARAAEAAYGFIRGRFTFNLNPVPTNALDLAQVGGTWLGQLRSDGLYVTIRAADRETVIAAAQQLSRP